MNQRDLWRMYFVGAIAAAATIERHNYGAMAERASDIADAMLRADEARWGGWSPPSVEEDKHPPRVDGATPGMLQKPRKKGY